MATGQDTVLGRDSKVFVMTESAFGTFTKAVATGAQRIEEGDIEKTEEPKPRKVFPGTRSVISFVEDRRMVKWNLKMPCIPSGTNATPPDCHELLMMVFGGSSGYSSGVYTLKASQSARPTATITAENNSALMKVATGAYADECKFTYSNGMPMWEFSGGAKDYGWCTPTTLKTTISASATSFNADDPHAINPPCVVQIGANDTNVSVTAKQFKATIVMPATITSLEDSVLLVYRNGNEITITEADSGGDWNAVTDADTCATNLAAALDAISGISATASTDTVTVTWDAGTISGGVENNWTDAFRTARTSAVAWTIDNFATLTCSAVPAGSSATAAIIPYVPSMTLNPNDEPISGLRGTFTWTFQHSPAQITDLHLSEMELSIKNNDNGVANEMLNKTITDVEFGERSVTGKIKFRARKDFLRAFSGAGSYDFSSMKFVFGDVEGYRMTINIPKLKCLSQNVKVPQSEHGVVEIDFQAVATSATAENEVTLSFT